MLTTPSFKKSLIVEQFQGNYLKGLWNLVTGESSLMSSYILCEISSLNPRRTKKHLIRRAQISLGT